MDSRDIKNVKKILEHAQSIIDETASIKNETEFYNDNNVSKAALFDLLQIGEISKNLSQAYLHESSLPWKDIYNLRNRIVHGYADVDYIIIWQTIQLDIPELIKDLTKAIK